MKCSHACPRLLKDTWKCHFSTKFIAETANSIRIVAKKRAKWYELCEKKCKFVPGRSSQFAKKSVKLHLPDMKVKKKLKKDCPESLRRKSFMSPKVVSCRKVWFHVERCNFMSEVVKALNPTWKCIMVTWNCKTPTWKWLHNQKNFMSRKCKFHVAEKVDFSDAGTLWCPWRSPQFVMKNCFYYGTWTPKKSCRSL